jgi:hypothetical protein
MGQCTVLKFYFYVPYEAYVPLYSVPVTTCDSCVPNHKHTNLGQSVRFTYIINKVQWRWANQHNNDDGATRMSYETSRTPLPLVLRSQWNIESVASRMINRFRPSSFPFRSIRFSLCLSHNSVAICSLANVQSISWKIWDEVSKEQSGVGTLCYTVRFPVDIISLLSPSSPLMAQHKRHSFISNYKIDETRLESSDVQSRQSGPSLCLLRPDVAEEIVTFCIFLHSW